MLSGLKMGNKKIYFIAPVFSSLPPHHSAIICSSRGQWELPAFCGVCSAVWTGVTVSPFPLLGGKMLPPLRFWCQSVLFSSDSTFQSLNLYPCLTEEFCGMYSVHVLSSQSADHQPAALLLFQGCWCVSVPFCQTGEWPSHSPPCDASGAMKVGHPGSLGRPHYRSFPSL